ncbi:MAG: insulinase family protein [Reichenbachiella sp.]
MLEYELVELPNKIRVVHRQVSNTKVAHCAMMLDVGSRDEKEDQQGLAHFWEHMVFKGTEKRKAYHIINRLESLGGELNAYTTKEKICFYSAILDKHLDKSVELLTDITFNSIFPPNQIEKERHVILEEMSMYLDNPEDAIQDQLDTLVFKDHQFGNNILGSRESVSAFQKKDFDRFIDENIDTSRIVFSSMGNYSMKQLLMSVEKCLGAIPAKERLRKRAAVNVHQPVLLNEKKELLQAHVGIGTRAFPMHSDDRVPFFVLNNILGGQSMTSKLNMSLREKYGLVYNVESNYQTYSDTGMFSIFYATEGNKVKKSLDLIQKELKKMGEVELTPTQLVKAKEQIKGQMAMAEENNQNFMLMMAKSMLDFDKIDTMEHVFRKVDEVSSTKLVELSQQVLQLDQMSILVYEPS